MDTRQVSAADAVPQAIDRELSMIRAAIDLVASGGSPRVVLSGLHFVDPLLAQARQLAGPARVRVVPLWTAAEEAVDLAIEPAGEAKTESEA